MVLEKNVRLKIQSEIYIWEEYFEQENELSDGNPKTTGGTSPRRDQMEFITEAKMCVRNGRLEIVYSENEISGLEGTQSRLSFDLEKRDPVTLIRTGNLSTTFIFSNEQKRYLCTYETIYMPIEFCICTNQVINNIDYSGGEMKLDYYLEVHGVKTERNFMKITVMDA